MGEKLQSMVDPYICPVGVVRPERGLERPIASQVISVMAGLIGETANG